MRIPFLSAKTSHSATAQQEIAAITDAPKEALTILLPSKGRPAMLKSLLRYYNDSRLPYKIIVLLSGDEGMHHAQDYPELDLVIRHYPEGIGFPEKLADGATLVKTPLTALCTDDDITLTDGLKKCAGFLYQHPDFSAAQGYHAYFSHQNSAVNLLNIAWFTPSQEANDPLTRVHQTLQRYQPVCWAVFRTSTFHKFIDTLRPDLYLIFQELLWSLSALIDGKVKRLPLLYCLRRMDKGYISGHPFLGMFESPTDYFSQYCSYRTMLVDLLSPQVARNKASLTHLLDASHLCLLAREVDPGQINFFANALLANPSTTIQDDNIGPLLSPQPAHAASGWETQVRQDGIDYRLFPAFLRPQPAEEIRLPEGYANPLITSLAPYFYRP